jgi:hypothetical protein
LSFDELQDAEDLRSVITAALATTPVDEEGLRRGVWTYVRAERALGSSPASVIVILTELVDASKPHPEATRQSLTRQVILWCVEAYFGYLGSDIGGAPHLSTDDPDVPTPRIVSNR